MATNEKIAILEVNENTGGLLILLKWVFLPHNLLGHSLKKSSNIHFYIERIKNKSTVTKKSSYCKKMF